MAPGRWRVVLFGAGSLFGLLGILAVTTPSRARSGPYTPRADGEVLEHLPERLGGERPAEASSDPAQAERRAREQLELYQRTSDPRFLGRAEAQLAAFWQLAEPPLALAVLRAKIRASNHEFEAALADLERALVRDPTEVQARFERATIEVVLARYDAAARDCAQLRPLVSSLFAAGCEALVAGATGRATQARASLERELEGARTATPAQVVWAESLLGELAWRVGDLAAAERLFRRGLESSPDDAYTRGALADLLLDQRRFREVVSLLERFERVDGLLLRLAIAEQALAGSPAHSHVLGERFVAARLRGSAVHQREQARFELSLRRDPQRALRLALANFAVQREVWDIRLVLEAALAAEQPQAANAAVELVRRSELEDPTIARLVHEVKEGTR
jgi:tetratricopeptide (TPR) repeat protein